MNLGAQLKAASAFQDELARRAARDKELAAEEAALCRDLVVRHFFDYAFRLFEFRLLNGRVPGSVSLGGKTFRDAAGLLDTFKWSVPPTKSRLWREEGKGVWTDGHPCHHLWVEFDERCKAAGLAPQWTSMHDGMGMDSWYELTVSAN